MSQVIERTVQFDIVPIDIDVQQKSYDESKQSIQVLIDKYIKGDKGDPPVRGKDYWTPEDIQEFKDYCVNVITQQWFGTEAQYDYMVAHGMIQDDWIYFIYEGQGQQQPSYIDGNTLVINGAVLTDDNTTLQVYGYLENINTTLVLDNQI